MAGLLALGLPLALRRRRILPALLCCMLLGFVGSISGCGDNTTKYKVSSTGTPAGTVPVTVTATLNGGATYGTLSHSVTVNLTVTSANGQ